MEGQDERKSTKLGRRVRRGREPRTVRADVAWECTDGGEERVDPDGL